MTNPRSLFGERYRTGYGTRPAAQNVMGLVAVRDQDPFEALAQARCDFSIEKEPLGRMCGSRFIPTPGQYALVRRDRGDADHGEVLGTVGTQYTAIGPRQVVQAFQGLEYPLTHLGMYQGDFIMTYEVNQLDVAGDPVMTTLIVRAPQDGGGAVSVLFSPVRLFCANQLILAAKMASFSMNIAHVGDVDLSLSLARYVMGRVEAAKRETYEVFDRMARRRLVEEEIDQIIEAAWPYPALPEHVRVFNEIQALGAEEDQEEYQQLEARAYRSLGRWEETRRHMDRFREGARQMLARTNEEVPALADTAWAVWAGGVAATAAWRNGRDHSVDYSILFGDRAGEVRRAFDAAVDLLAVN